MVNHTVPRFTHQGIYKLNSISQLSTPKHVSMSG